MTDIIDIDMKFNKHPITNKVSMKSTENALSQSIVNVVLQSIGEQGFEFIGAGMYRAHFSLSDSSTQFKIKDIITEQINTHCDLCNLISVNVNFDLQNGEMSVDIIFSLINKTDEYIINVPIQLIR